MDFISFCEHRLEIVGQNQISTRTGKVIFPEGPIPKTPNDGESFPNINTHSNNMEEIIGATVGSIIFIVIVVSIVTIILRKQRNNKGKHEVAETVNMRYDVEDAEEKIDMIRPQSFLR